MGEVWANNTKMVDMGLTTGDGRTYKWYKGSVEAPFMFGEGLTYTNFSVIATDEGNGEYSVLVKNTGNVPASQTVMLFARPWFVPEAPLPMPNRQLFDFGRTATLKPGQTATLHFHVEKEAFAMVDYAGTRKAFAGRYEIEFFTGGKVPAATHLVELQSTTVLSTLPPPRRVQGIVV